MSCQWRDKVGLYVDDELDAPAEQQFAAHLSTCVECPGAVQDQMEFKKALRLAGRSFSAPPELHAAIYRSLHPHTATSPWWKWVLAPLCAMLLAAVSFLLWPKSGGTDPMVSGLVDQHITMLASARPLDVVNDDRHTVKPWFQGKLPFTFDLPDVKDSPFTLVGGKVVYTGQNPGAEVVYQIRQHKISVFIFQAKDVAGKVGSNRDQSFTVDGWRQGGLQFYLVTDANKEEAGKLVTMFQDANRG
jgi:anti-sigma factor RsiW